MFVIEKESKSEKKSKSDKKSEKSYKNSKGRKLKSQRINIEKYNKLLAKAEDLGIVSIEFDKDYSYAKKNKILRDILEKEGKQR